MQNGQQEFLVLPIPIATTTESVLCGVALEKAPWRSGGSWNDQQVQKWPRPDLDHSYPMTEILTDVNAY